MATACSESTVSVCSCCRWGWWLSIVNEGWVSHAGAVMHCFIGGQPPLNDLPVRNSLTRIIFHKRPSCIHFPKSADSTSPTRSPHIRF